MFSGDKKVITPNTQQPISYGNIFIISFINVYIILTYKHLDPTPTTTEACIDEQEPTMQESTLSKNSF